MITAEQPNITSINFEAESKVETIGGSAFQGLTRLTSITIPNSVAEIGRDAFRDCANLRTINYNATDVTDITSASERNPFGNAGANGEGITVNIGNNVTRIPNYLFNRVHDITSINFGTESKVETIGISAFNYLTRLTSVTIPNSVTTIGNSAFLGCTGLISVTIPNSVTMIGELAFRECTGLTSVTIGNSVTSIGNGAFRGCTNLTTLNYNITNVTTNLGTGTNHWLYDAGRSRPVTVNIGDNVTRIPDNLFYVNTVANRPNITAINIGATSAIQTIRNFAFRELTGLTSITIPNGVTSIGMGVFQGLTAIDSIISLNSTPPTVGLDAFSGVNPTACLYVPQSSIDDYKAADRWKDFLCINAITTTSITTDDRIIPPTLDDITVVAPINILAGEFTAGPNPVSKSSGSVAFYWQGRALSKGTLSVFDVNGNFVARVSISDNGTDTSRREIGRWNFGNVAEGTYVVRGVLNMADGSRERVSAVIGVVR